MNSKVSIIIPTYKRSNRIKRAIDSVLSQDYKNFELIVVDDNDPSDIERKLTEEAVNEYLSLPYFKYIQHDRNKNGSAARNTGIKASSGDYITFLDDDDEYYPHKIGLQVQILNNLDHNIWGACYTLYDKIDQYGKLQVSSELVEGNLLVQALSKNLYIGSGSNFMVTRKALNDINGFDESFKRNQDLEFLVRLLTKYKMKSISSSTFLIHNEIRENKFTFEELMEINSKYRKTFKRTIDSLNTKEQSEVWRTLDLWDIRSAVSRRKYLSAIGIFRKSQLTLSDVFKYLIYILKRLLTNKSYGFKLYN
ncbi:glycosyltransferase family 2 protein [Facklamia hominis]|uniref:glycosyltransferase family 2 protein n=1 Tax=Facklamia hominis TaxID=178214 RepID=UPI0038FCDE94